MNRSSLLISVLGLMLAALAVMMWLGRESDVLPAPPAQAEADLQIASTAESSGVEAEVVTGEPDEADADIAVDEAGREEVFIEIEDSPQLVIQVWNRKRGAVAPEAEVFVLEGYKPPDPYDTFVPHRCELAITLGKRYRASSAGQVAVPRLTRDAIVAARLPGSVGVANVRKYNSESSVILQPDETVTVRVVDQRGRPVVGVPVGVQQRIASRVETKQLAQEWKSVETRIESVKRRLAENPAQAVRQRQLADLQRVRTALVEQWRQVKEASSAKSGKSGEGAAKKSAPKQQLAKKGEFSKARPAVTTRMELRARRKTDEHGLAVFRHFQFHRQRGQGWWPKQHHDRFEAILMVPLVEAVRAPFRGKPVPEESIELQMPATGSIALRTVDRDGRPFTHPVHGELRIVDGKNPGWMRVPIRKQQNEREIVFPFVGLGMQMQSSCRLDDNDFRWRSPSFDGPQRAGERITMDLVVAPDDAMLCGRIFDEAGAPLANAKTTFLINSMRGRLEGEEVLLDDEGRFHLPFQVRSSHQSPFRLQIRHQDRLPVPGLARTLGVLPKQGVVDLGELQLGVMPPITFGRVVNDLGEGIVGARVQLQREREVGGRSSRQQWQDEAFTEVRSDQDGKFWLYGDLESARYRLRVTATEHFPFEQPSLPGRESVVIELLRRSRVVGTALLPEWLPSRRVKVNLLSHLNPKSNREGSIRDYRGKKFIYFDWTRPGIYSLTFRVDGFPDPFARVDNLEIRAGQHDEHPRLKNIDLGRELYRFEVFAVDETGKPMTPKSPLLARVMRPNGQYSLVGFQWRRGRTEVFSSQSSLQILPEAQGFRAERATLVAGRSEVRFTRIQPLSLRAPGMRRLVGEQSVWISVELANGPQIAEFDSGSRRMARTVRRSTSSHGALRGDDTANLTPVRDGRYRVIARLGDKRRGGLVSVPLGEVDVRLPVGGAPQVLTVAVDTQAVQAAMQEVARRAAAAAAQPRGSRK